MHLSMYVRVKYRRYTLDTGTWQGPVRCWHFGQRSSYHRCCHGAARALLLHSLVCRAPPSVRIALFTLGGRTHTAWAGERCKMARSSSSFLQQQQQQQCGRQPGGGEEWWRRWWCAGGLTSESGRRVAGEAVARAEGTGVRRSLCLAAYGPSSACSAMHTRTPTRTPTQKMTKIKNGKVRQK